jgi:hypothetical protein
MRKPRSVVHRTGTGVATELTYKGKVRSLYSFNAGESLVVVNKAWYHLIGQSFVIKSWYTNRLGDMYITLVGRLGSYLPRNFLPAGDPRLAGVRIWSLDSMDSSMI